MVCPEHGNKITLKTTCLFLLSFVLDGNINCLEQHVTTFSKKYFACTTLGDETLLRNWIFYVETEPGLSSMPTPTILSKNVDVVIFMQLLVIPSNCITLFQQLSIFFLIDSRVVSRIWMQLLFLCKCPVLKVRLQSGPEVLPNQLLQASCLCSWHSEEAKAL